MLFQWQLEMDASLYGHQIVVEGSATYVYVFQLPLADYEYS